MPKVHEIAIPTFTYDELPDSAKEKVLCSHRDINVDYQWYEWTLELLQEQWEKHYGITFEWKSVGFDLDRRYWHFYFHGRGKISVTDPLLLAWAVCHKKSVLDAVLEGNLEFYFDTHYYGGGSARTELCVDDRRDADAPDLPVDFDQWFRHLTHCALNTLEKEYDYLTGDEAVAETIRINEYEFLENGKTYRQPAGAAELVCE